MSTRNALKEVSRKYCLKFRADLALENRNITVAQSENLPPDRWRLLRSKITISNLYLRDPRKFPLLFHPSDIVHFGLTTDIRSFWEAISGFITEREVLHDKPRYTPLCPYFGYTRFWYVPEQYLTIRWLRSNGIDAYLSDVVSLDRDQFALWAAILEANFQVIDWQHSGVRFPERFFVRGPFPKTVLRAADTQKLFSKRAYWRACVNKHVIGFAKPFLMYLYCYAVLRHKAPPLYRLLRWLLTKFQQGKYLLFPR
jgi:hypothetical protein